MPLFGSFLSPDDHESWTRLVLGS